ncbi:response regulator [Pseudomonas putida]|jgi:FixJ family two-component response regulator|uniref:response regulator transcription factor n=1 Tax=Pseudomonas putida TaxID=303 RepID=UPI002364563F|nr:response regulator [Pseudomonas putida]MDD1968257.1 response regulator [Pseudomonas putida]
MRTDDALAQGRKAVTNDPTPVVFVVDDDVSVRESLELLIDFAKWRPRLFESARAFLDQPQAPVPSCLVLDINLPDLNGLDLQNMIATERPDLPIIFLTGYGDVPLTVRAMKAGAMEFLTKPFDDEVLLRAIADALDHSRAALVREDGLRSLRSAHATLTPREHEVLGMVVAGRLNKVIASDLGISEITVKAHRGKVMRKMKARSVADLVRMSALLGLR